VTEAEASFHEARAERKVQALPLSHLSLELGHLYFEDFAAGKAALKQHFQQVAPWAAAARAIFERANPGRTARISTCFLIDDYFGPSSAPTEVIPDLLAAAKESDLEIDYLARESACANADGVPVARLVEERIVADPPPDTNGSRPPATETGWLCNGQRSPSGKASQAMDTTAAWAAPVQNSANRHSIFVDVELWNVGDRGRVWSCAFLASVWQLLRLGMLRYDGMTVAAPKIWDEPLPEDWGRLPAVTQLNPKAAPFSAYRNLSVLPARFLPTEQAVRTILAQVAIDSTIVDQVLNRAHKEGFSVPPEPVDRIDYIFTG
jgi:hypothetical protein